jgi:hypothetical protein
MQDETVTETTIADPLAVRIMDEHQRAEELTTRASLAIHETIEARRGVAALVDAAKAEHRNLRGWWENNLPAIPYQATKSYLAIHRISDRGDHDKRQLMLAGILPAPSSRGEQEARQPDPLAWVETCRKLSAVVEAIEPERIPRAALVAVIVPIRRLRDLLTDLLEGIE